MYRNQQVIGYIFDHNGRYENKFFFKGTTENIASFIMNNSSSTTMITDMMDMAIVTSMFGFLDRVSNKDFLKELQPEIIKMQYGQKDPIQIDFKQTEYGVMMQDELIKDHYFPYIPKM